MTNALLDLPDAPRNQRVLAEAAELARNIRANWDDGNITIHPDPDSINANILQQKGYSLAYLRGICPQLCKIAWAPLISDSESGDSSSDDGNADDSSDGSQSNVGDSTPSLCSCSDDDTTSNDSLH